MKGVMKSGDDFLRIAATFNSGGIQAITTGVIADCKRERECVFNNYGVTADVSFSPNATKLMNSRVGTNICAIFNRYVASEGGGVGHDHTIAYDAVVRNMGLRHDQTVIADLGKHATPECASMNRDELANMVAAANASLGWLTLVFQILRGQTNGDERVNMGTVADSSFAIDDAVRVQTNTIAKFNLVSDD